MEDYYSIYNLSDSLGTFEVMTIFSPKPEEYDDVLRNIKSRELSVGRLGDLFEQALEKLN